jgi:hypothetical protein
MAEKYVGIIPHKTNDLKLSEKSTVIYTVGGIDITTNLNESQTSAIYPPKFSDFYTTETIGDENVLIGTINSPSKSLTPLLDKTNPKYYAKFGSMLELVRVALDTIILKFPAAINSVTTVFNKVGNNIISAGYNPYTKETKFLANTNFFSNPFGIYYLDNLNYRFQDERVADIRNLTKNYLKYELVVGEVSYPILNLIPAAKSTNSFIEVTVSGDPFDTGDNSIEFYIKPIESEINNFYFNLSQFESYLLNPETGYKAIFKDRKETDGGVVLNYKIGFTFPMIDAYNIDVTSQFYEGYVQDLVDFATRFDEGEGNILMRKLVPENVQSVTMEDVNGQYPTYGEINRLLIVYGRELDVLNSQIEGIRFLNTVTYDGNDNMPESLLFEFVKALGWEINELPKEVLKILAINSNWIFKSKGTKNPIEFILDLMGIPLDIIEFNQYILKAKRPIDVNRLKFLYSLISPDTDFPIESLPITEDGYPRFFDDTEEDYFQRYGEIDRGLSYFYKYYNLLPNGFTGSSVTYTEEVNSFKRLFEQDFDGTGSTLTYSVVNNLYSTSECFNVSGETITDPLPEIFRDDCGCIIPISDKVLKVCVEPKEFTGCTSIILDAWYDCISGDTAELHYNIFGGKPPYIVSGGTEGQILTTGQTISLIAFDQNGCSSNIAELTVECINPCLITNIEVDLSYSCILDEFGQNTGLAIASVTATGGTEPYTFIGVQSGDTVNHGQIITVEVIDANGCSSGLIGLTVDCEAPSPVTCEEITLISTLETTSVNLAEKSATVNVVYSLEDLPFGYIIDTVTLVITGVGTGDTFVVGSPITETFNSLNGAETVSLSYNPISVQTSITLEIELTAVFANGCTYTNDYTLTVNPRQLGSTDNYSNTLYP